MDGYGNEFEKPSRGRNRRTLPQRIAALEADIASKQHKLRELKCRLRNEISSKRKRRVQGISRWLMAQDGIEEMSDEQVVAILGRHLDGDER